MTRLGRTEKPTDSGEKYAKLRSMLQRLIDIGHPYAARMAERGLRPEHLTNRDDLVLFPTTTKYDLLSNYPFGWFARESREIVRVHATSGVTGKPTLVAYTAEDVKMWSENVAWCMGLSGVNEDDIVQVSFGYGLFTGGFGVHDGASLLGAMVVPISGGFTDRQISVMRDIGATVLACTPSYALRIAERMESDDAGGIKLRLGFFGGEAWSDELRTYLERVLGIVAVDMYGLGEAMGPGVSAECGERNGLHISDDFIAEVVDPKTLERTEDGETGELVLTSWNRQAFPVIRYRTRDITSLNTDPCPCGEPAPRMARVSGRSDDMLIFRGVDVFPKQIESAVAGVPGLTANFHITVRKEKGVQDLKITCERSPDSKPEDEDATRQFLEKSIKNSTGVSIPFEIVEPGGVARSDGKAIRVLKK
jgi:phenylacetate-CoA ligase